MGSRELGKGVVYMLKDRPSVCVCVLEMSGVS